MNERVQLVGGPLDGTDVRVPRPSAALDVEFHATGCAHKTHHRYEPDPDDDSHYRYTGVVPDKQQCQ